MSISFTNKKIVLGITLIILSVSAAAYFLSARAVAHRAEKAAIERFATNYAEMGVIADNATARVFTDTVFGISRNASETASQNLDQLKGWYKDWYNADLNTSAPNENLLKVQNAEDVDLVFTEVIVERFEYAIELAKELERLSQHKEIKDMASRAISAHEVEVPGWKKSAEELRKYPPGTIGRSGMIEHKHGPGD